MKTEYLIIIANSVSVLEKRVRARIELGWKVSGGVTFKAGDPSRQTTIIWPKFKRVSNGEYYQSMIRESEENN